MEVKYSHTNVVRIEKNGQMLFDADSDSSSENSSADRSGLSIENIKDFADNIDLRKISPMYD